MKAFSLSLFVTGALGALASFEDTKRIKRELSCGLAEKFCGIYCIPIGYKCCPDEQGGCPLTTTCQLGDNGEYGCCPIGKTCIGDGGVTGGTRTITSTSTSIFISISTSTTVIDITSTTISSDFDLTSTTSAPKTTSSSSTLVESSSSTSTSTLSVPTVVPSSSAISSPTTVPTAGAAMNAGSLFGAMAVGAAAWML